MISQLSVGDVLGQLGHGVEADIASVGHDSSHNSADILWVTLPPLGRAHEMIGEPEFVIDLNEQIWKLDAAHMIGEPVSQCLQLSLGVFIGKELAIAAMEARITSLERQLEAREREVGQLPLTGPDRPQCGSGAALVEILVAQLVRRGHGRRLNKEGGFGHPLFHNDGWSNQIP